MKTEKVHDAWQGGWSLGDACARSTGQEGFRAAQECRRRYCCPWPRVAGVAAAVHRTHRQRGPAAHRRPEDGSYLCLSGLRRQAIRVPCGRATVPAWGRETYRRKTGAGTVATSRHSCLPTT